MSWSLSACSWLSLPRTASSPPWIFGCSVFTRPSIISGTCVISATSITLRPASRKALAVPPVEISSTPWAERPRAKSTSPVLSLTERSARAIFCMGRMSRGANWQAARYHEFPPWAKLRRGTSLRGGSGVTGLRQARLAWCRGPFDRPRDLNFPLFFEAALKHDLEAAARPTFVGKKHAFFERDRRGVGAERPGFEGRQHEPHALLVLSHLGADARMQMEADRIAAAARLRLAFEALGRGKRVFAAHQQAIGRELDAARMGDAEAGGIALMRALEHQRPVLLVERGLHIRRADQLGIGGGLGAIRSGEN